LNSTAIYSLWQGFLEDSILSVFSVPPSSKSHPIYLEADTKVRRVFWLGQGLNIETLLRNLAYSARRESAKNFATKSPLWIDEMCFRDFAKSFVIVRGEKTVFKYREFVLFLGAISNVPGKRKTESKKSIFLSVLGKCEYEMCLVSTWKADTVFLCYCSGL